MEAPDIAKELIKFETCEPLTTESLALNGSETTLKTLGMHAEL